MNAAQRIEAVFAGDLIDCVPFALKGWRIPQCEAERTLRNQGMCVFDARSVYQTHSPNVQTETLHFSREGVGYQRTTIRTPKGELSTLSRQLLREAAPGDRFIIGITENVPEDRWRVSFSAILNTLNEYGRLPILPEAL